MIFYYFSLCYFILMLLLRLNISIIITLYLMTDLHITDPEPLNDDIVLILCARQSLMNLLGKKSLLII